MQNWNFVKKKTEIINFENCVYNNLTRNNNSLWASKHVFSDSIG